MASEVRAAYGYLLGGNRRFPVAVADDAGVHLLGFDTQVGPFEELSRSWADMLPDQREGILSGLEWEPIEPKHPLIQLGDTLLDWSDDDE